MKLKNILLAGILATAATFSASADTITITGSTAFRSQTMAAIQAVLAPGFTVAYTGASLSGTNAAIFKGTFAGNPITVNCSWAGSAGGIQTTAATAPTKDVGVFDPVNQATSVLPGTANQADPRTGAIRARPDIAMSDNTQSSSKFNGTFLGVTYTNLVNATITTLTPPSPQPVGVVPFNWVASESAPGASGSLNMTGNFAQALYTGVGAAPYALLTGLAADQGTIVYATGRDPDSGTRIISFAESGIGANSFVQQHTLAISGNAITGVSFNAAGSLLGVPFGIGESGESSGGTLAGKLGTTGPTAATPFSGGATNYGAGFCIGYLGASDTVTAVAAGAKTMLWNGNTNTEANIIDGKYTFWSYERLFYRPGTAGQAKSFADAVATNIYNAVSTLNIFDMQVSRTVDGGVIGALYF